MEVTTKRTRPAIVVLICALLGAAVFLALYGIPVLNPAYTDWLMDGGGLSRGYLGFRLFQSADWQFPPGMMGSLGYPQQASIATTDSVPLLALAGKLVSLVYDGPFQYFGIWALLCFVLQGVFGGLICLGITRSSWQAVLGSLAFLLSPVLWQNTFFSAGLAGHWVILAALLPLVYRRESAAKGRQHVAYWGLLGALSIGIHAQLALICGILCMGYCVYGVVNTGQRGKLAPLGVFLGAAVLIGWALGMFSSGGIGDIRLFGIRFSGLWDAHNYSRILTNLTNPGDYQYAGFAYVGFGVLAVFALALVWQVRSAFSREGNGKALLGDIWARRADVAAYGSILLACILLGLSQPVVYLIMLLALSVLAHKMSRRLMSAALVCCLCLQVYDVSAVFQIKRMHYNQTMRYAQADETPDWDALLQGDNWSTVGASPGVLESVHLAPLAEAIAQSGQTLNTLSYASASQEHGWEQTLGNPQQDMMFVFTAEELLDEAVFQSVFANVGYLYQWNELVVGFVRPTLLPTPQIFGVEDIAYLYRYPIGKNMHLRSGEDIGGIRYIYPGGLSYGPYLTLEPGQYALRITGERLDEAAIRFTLDEGAMEPAETSSRPTERVYHLDVTEAVTKLEILIENNTAQPLLFDGMTVTQLGA